MTEQYRGGADPRGPRSESKQVAGEVREDLRRAANAGKERARTFLDEHKGSAADSAHGFADALRDTARRMDDGGNGSSVSYYAERAAEGIDQLADAIRERELADVVGEIQRFARRSPALFIGGSIAVGLVVGRFLRSSRSHAHPSSHSSSPSRYEHGRGAYGGEHRSEYGASRGSSLGGGLSADSGFGGTSSTGGGQQHARSMGGAQEPSQRSSSGDEQRRPGSSSSAGSNPDERDRGSKSGQSPAGGP